VEEEVEEKPSAEVRRVVSMVEIKKDFAEVDYV